MRSAMILGVLAIGTTCAWTPCAQAATPQSVTPPHASSQPQPSKVSAAPASSDGIGKRVDPTRLAGMSGGTDVSQEMTLNGTVGDNQVDHVVTGNNVISGDSFSGAAGVPMVIQNTGNSVLIQNATIVNVQFTP